MSILFYSLSFSIIFFSCCVIFSRNPINSIIFLILTFLFLAFMLIILNLKFIAFILIVLYAGAISILFLFIILTLNIKNVDLKETSAITTLERVVGGLLLVKFNLSLFFASLLQPSFTYNLGSETTKQLISNYVQNTQFDLFLISMELYNYFSLHFLVVGLTIFITMVGVVIITKNVKKS